MWILHSFSDRRSSTLYGLPDDPRDDRDHEGRLGSPQRTLEPVINPMYDRSGRTLNALFWNKNCYITSIGQFFTTPSHLHCYYAPFICYRHCPIWSLLGFLANIRQVYRQVSSWKHPGTVFKELVEGYELKNRTSCKKWLKLNEGVFPQLFNAHAWDFHKEIAEKCGQALLSIIQDWQCYTARRQCYQDKGPFRCPS